MIKLKQILLEIYNNEGFLISPEKQIIKVGFHRHMEWMRKNRHLIGLTVAQNVYEKFLKANWIRVSIFNGICAFEIFDLSNSKERILDFLIDNLDLWNEFKIVENKTKLTYTFTKSEFIENDFKINMKFYENASVKNNVWKKYNISTLSEEQLNNVYFMFKETYNKMKNILRSVNSAEKLKNHKSISLIDYDNDLEDDCFIIYNPTQLGNKIIYLGSKNNLVAKSILIDKLKELLNSSGWFIEGGRKIENFCVKYNIPFIEDAELISKIIKKKDIQMLDNGYYNRKAAFGASVKKRLYGKI